MGLTIDWSEVIQSVIVVHLAPSHCRNFTDPPPSWSKQDTFSACMKPVAPSCFSFLSSMLRFSRPQRTWSPVMGLPLTGDQVRWGLENLNIDDKKQIGR